MELCPRNGLPIALEMELRSHNGLPITLEVELRPRNTIFNVFLTIFCLPASTLKHVKSPKSRRKWGHIH